MTYIPEEITSQFLSQDFSIFIRKANNMSIIIVFLTCLLVSSTTALNFRDPFARERIIKVKEPTDAQKSPQAPWTTLTRGQFMRDILFGIHPDSPINRDYWIKSGFIRPEIPPTQVQLRSRNVPIDLIQSNSTEASVKTENKAKRPLRRKIPPASKRFPKVAEINVPLVKVNVSETKVSADKSVEKAPASILKDSAPILNAPSISMPLLVPIEQDKTPNDLPQVPQPPKCFIQKPLPLIYYLLPSPPQGQVPIPPNQNFVGRPYPSLFESGFYAPIQNRFPFPPQHAPPIPIIYLQPVPLDLIAMDGGQFEREVSLRQELKPATTSTLPPVPIVATEVSSTKAPGAITEKPVVKEVSKPVHTPDTTDLAFRQESLTEVSVTSEAAETTTDSKIIKETEVQDPISVKETIEPKGNVVNATTEKVESETVKDIESIASLSGSPGNSIVVTRVEESHSEQ